MNTKKISLTLFSLLLLVLLFNLANAQEDFTVTSLPSIELCPCSNQAYAVTVQNTGSIASSYTVLPGGSAAEWVNFNPKKFILNPDEKGSFFVFVNSRCNIEGDYDLEIFVTTNNGLTKVIRQNLKFSQCYDFSLEQGEIIEEIGESVSFFQHDGSYSLCKDEQKSIPILITNNENFENRYKLFLDAPEWAALNVDNVRLDAKKLGVFFINFDTTDVEEGEYNLKLSAISELGKVQRKKNVEVNVEKCYALEVELEKEEDDICGSEYISYEVSITNLGTLRQLVEVEVDGPDWAGFEITARPKVKTNETDNETKSSKTEPESTLSGKEVLQLNPDEEKIIELNMNPGDVSGNFEITVHATPDNKTEFRASDTINVNVIEKLTCYEADISMKTRVSNFYSRDIFYAKVKNDGIKKATYDVSLEGVDWVSVSPKTLELNPGQTGNLNLDVNPAMDVEPGTYGVKINLESNDLVYSKNVDIVLKKESEFAKKLKAGLKFYQYYIYLLILIVILIFVFRKPIKKRYEKYKVKEARLEALKLAREKRAKEIKKKVVVKEEKKKKPIKKESKPSKKYKAWRYIIILLFIIAIGIFIGHQTKLFNAKYLHIYIKNFFIGYLYYILIGVGVLVVLFLFLLFYNFIRKGKKRVKWNKVLIPIIIALILIGLVSALVYFNVFDEIKDFFVLYSFYIILGIVILVVIILLIRFYKPLFKFFRK